MQQLREIHVSILTNPYDNLEKSMFQFRQIHATTQRYTCNNFDKSNNLSKKRSEQSDGLTRQGNDPIKDQTS